MDQIVVAPTGRVVLPRNFRFPDTKLSDERLKEISKLYGR